MTSTGHDARTQAVLENLRRRKIETRAEHLPDDIRKALMEMVDRIAGLEALVSEQAQTISTLNLELIATKRELAEFRANVNAVGRHFAETAA
jgi:uncharacterized coiled-coil protein SlyX